MAIIGAHKVRTLGSLGNHGNLTHREVIQGYRLSAIAHEADGTNIGNTLVRDSVAIGGHGMTTIRHTHTSGVLRHTLNIIILNDGRRAQNVTVRAVRSAKTILTLRNTRVISATIVSRNIHGHTTLITVNKVTCRTTLLKRRGGVIILVTSVRKGNLKGRINQVIQLKRISQSTIANTCNVLF